MPVSDDDATKSLLRMAVASHAVWRRVVRTYGGIETGGRLSTGWIRT